MKLNKKGLLVFFIILSIGVIGCSKQEDNKTRDAKSIKLDQSQEAKKVDGYDENNKEDQIDEYEVIKDLKEREDNVDNKYKIYEDKETMYLQSNMKDEKEYEKMEKSKGRIVYITDGNSYYHSSPSCKFLAGAHVRAVGINEVDDKYPCECIKDTNE